jgi:metal-responsive CopG/Arc/MetJ family transcriptional regulator
LKHNISITMDQKLFRELETIRGREKRSTFIEHLIVLGLRDYAASNQKKMVKTIDTAATLLPAPMALSHEPTEF